MESKTYLKVESIQVLTIPNPEEQTNSMLSLPFLRFELENGDEFIMAGIPIDIALQISRYLHDIKIKDSRMQLHDLIIELAVIKKVEIDSIVPKTEVYQATIELQLEGFTHPLYYQMVPSHATLLAIASGAPIYVSKFLVAEESRGI